MPKRRHLTNQEIAAELIEVKTHAQVSRVMRITSQPNRYCGCCGQKIYIDPFSINCQVEQFLHLGILFPLYFTFLKHLGVFMTIACIFAIPNIIFNSEGNSCVSKLNIICDISVTNLVSEQESIGIMMYFQTLSNYVFIGVAIIYLQVMTNQLKKAKMTLASICVNEYQYGIIVKGVKSQTKQLVYEQIKWLQKQYKQRTGKDNIIVKFILIMNVQNIPSQEVLEQAQQTVLQKPEQPILSQQQILQTILLPEAHKSESQKSEEEQQLQVEFTYKFSGKVIVLFQYPISHRQFQNSRVQQLTDSSDVIWENIGVEKEVSKNVLLFFGTGILMFITFYAILALKQYIKKLSEGQHWVITTILNLLVATIVAIFNSIEGIVIRYCARRQLYGTHSKFFRIVARRLSYIFFINMVATTFCANLYIFLQRKDQRVTKWLPLNYSGLVNDFFFLFLTNSYISSIFNYFDLFWGAKLIRRYKAEQLRKIQSYSKDQLRFIFQGHPVDMGLRYGNIMKTLFFTAAISPFVPAGTFLSLLGLLICYWVDKYLLLRRYVCRNQLNWNFAKDMLQFSKFYVVLFSFSNILIQMIPIDTGADIEMPDFQKHSNFYISIFIFFFCLLYKIWFNQFKKAIFGKSIRSFRNKMNYNEAKPKFQNKYEDKLIVTDVMELKEEDIKVRITEKFQEDKKLKESIRQSILQRYNEDNI